MATTYAPKTISPKQAAFIASLIESRQVPQSLVLKFTEDMTSVQASKLIDALKLCPWKPKNGVSAKTPAKPVDIVSEGFYCVTEGLLELVYYKVQTSKSSGKRYALRWNGKKWEFAPGAIYKISKDDVLTAEQAKKFAKKTGKCCICSKTLVVKRSVELGYGPTCADNMDWPY